eukprot:984396-Rhodomonas_salina.1
MKHKPPPFGSNLCQGCGKLYVYDGRYYTDSPGKQLERELWGVSAWCVTRSVVSGGRRVLWAEHSCGCDQLSLGVRP